MRQFSSLNDVSFGPCWLTIGSFDGVHRGHQFLIRQMVQEAHQAGVRAVVLTFYPHPGVVLHGQQGPFYLTSPEEQAELISELEVDALIILPFTREFAGQTAEEFFSMLQQHIQFQQLWIGRDFALGRNRQGDLSVLMEIGRKSGFTVKQIQAVINGGEDISSRHIRQLIMAGQVEEAARQLGRWYFVGGKIVAGDGRGNGLGFPTANLQVAEDRLLPANGVYSCLANLEGQQIPGVANVGYRPTFTDGTHQIRLEVHLLDFHRDIYGQTMRVQFVRRLRGEIQFEKVEELVSQVNQDVQITRGIFANGNPTPDLPA